MDIAVLITCHNRKQHTIDCLKMVYDQQLDVAVNLRVYIVDDGSTDGTYEAVSVQFPDANIKKGNGSLFWAGGMRTAWNMALDDNSTSFDYYLLLNDDTVLYKTAIADLLNDIAAVGNEKVIMVGSTLDNQNQSLSYGGSVLHKKGKPHYSKLSPNNQTPQLCDLGNANVMLVSDVIVDKIGILSDKFTHGIADYDYTLRAKKAGFKVYVASKYAGLCVDDHGNNWKSSKQSSLKQRIAYLYSVKGLAYKEYLFYIKSHFPSFVPQAWALLWAKTFFPFIWEKFKAKKT